VDVDVDDDEEAPVAPRGPRTTPFGSVWDSQLGTTAAPSSANLAPLNDDDEDFDEPEIPEYLIAEQRRGARPGAGARGGQGGRGGPRGGRAAYQSAVERERYGGGRGAGGLNRYPDVSGRTGGTGAPARGPRDDRAPRDDRGPRRDDRPREAAPRATSSSEPWSEVPPELEAMLRAQVGQKPTSAPGTLPSTEPESLDVVAANGAGADVAETAAPKRRAVRKTAASTSSDGDTATTAAPKRRSTRKPAAEASASTGASDVADAAGTAEAPAPKRRTTRKTTASAAEAAPGDDAGSPAAPKRRSTRKATTDTTEPA
jgi:hypothetical protein